MSSADFSDFNIGKLRRGDTIPLVIHVTKSGQPMPLTGVTMWFTAKRGENDTDNQAVIRKSTDTTGITPSDTIGEAFITIDPADTATLPMPLTLICDVQIREPGGQVTTVASGKLTFLADVTRAT